MLMNSLEHELRIEAMRLAVSYCKENANEPLILIAEKIYQFLTKEEKEKIYQDTVEKINKILLEKS